MSDMWEKWEKYYDFHQHCSGASISDQRMTEDLWGEVRRLGELVTEMQGYLREMGLRRCTNCASIDLLKYCPAVKGTPPEYFGCSLWKSWEG